MPSVPSFMRPSRTVPVTWWSASSRWRARPSTFLILAVGQWVFGTGEAFLVQSGLGTAPWTVLAQGLGLRLSLSIGLMTFIVSMVVLLLWVPLKERPGLGTIMNALIIAAALQTMLNVIPDAHAVGVELAYVFLGIGLIGIGSGFYLTANLGPGPRDGWMTGLHLRFGWPVARVRLGIEAVVLVLGWLLGGTVGIGTVLFALLIGPSVGYGLLLAGHVGGRGTTISDAHPELEA